jgi:hypothetical protein
MSAGYVFGALGFYPLQMGSPYYVVGSPLFKQATIHLEGGRDLVINAPNNSARNVYVQGLRLNGRPHSQTYLSADDLAKGGTLQFDMGPSPSLWGTGPDDAPPSIAQNDKVPEPLRDVTGADRGEATASAGGGAAVLFDDNSSTETSLDGTTPWIQYHFARATKQPVRFYTLTSGAGDAASDPSGWVVKGSNDGTSWDVLDERGGETFKWHPQTRPFKLAHPGE